MSFGIVATHGEWGGEGTVMCAVFDLGARAESDT